MTRRVALVIGAGSVKCAAALGLWRTLIRHGIELNMVVGCSGGSLYAAQMALGRDVETCARLTRELWTKDVTTQRNTRGLLAALFPRMLGFEGKFGMVSDARLNRALHSQYAGHTFAETTIPLHIVTTDLESGQRVVLSEGSIFDAVRASIAIPYVWQPWKVGGRWMLDGCMSDPLPVDVAIREGADVILAMGFESPMPRKVRSPTRYAFQINTIYTNNLLRANYSFHNLAHHAEIIPVLPEFDRPVGLFSTDQFPYVIEQGERAAEAQIPYLKRLLASTAE